MMYTSPLNDRPKTISSLISLSGLGSEAFFEESMDLANNSF